MKIKIAELKVRQHGRGKALGLPATWLKDLEIKTSDTIEVYRDVEDNLILTPKVKTA